jgi:hypothetical protein
VADNISVKDASGTSITLGTKDLTNVHFTKHVIVDTSGNTMPSGDAAARPVIVRLADGTTSQTLLDADAAVDERTDHFMPALSALFARDPAASAGSQQVPLEVEDSTNINLNVSVRNGSARMPAMDAIARTGHVRLNDGTTSMVFMDVDGAVDERLDYYMPAAAAMMGTDSAASAGSKVVPLQCVSTAVPILKTALYSSGGVAIKEADDANLADYLTAGTLLAMGPGEEVAQAHIVTGTTTPSATLSAVASTKYVVRWISASLAAASNQAPLLVTLTQDKAGTPVILWKGVLAALANTSAEISLTGLCIPMTVANKTLHLEVTAGTIVSTNYIALNFGASRAA